MPRPIRVYVRCVDRVNRIVGRAAMYLIFAMMGLLLFSAFDRLAIRTFPLWVVEMAEFLMTGYYFLGGAYSMQLDGHVRMDLLYGRMTPRRRALMDVVTIVTLLKGLRVYMFPTGGRFMTRFGVVPISLRYEDVQVAIRTGELDGVAWSGITEVYSVGWADVTKYYLTNPISGAWAGSYFVNEQRWAELPENLKVLFRMSIDHSHYYRLHWYWWGEAHYRAKGGKLQLTSIPESEWKAVEDEAYKFWDEAAKRSKRTARVVDVLKQYAEIMRKAGPPYRDTIS